MIVFPLPVGTMSSRCLVLSAIPLTFSPVICQTGIFQRGGTSPSSKTLQTPIEFPVEPPTIQPFGEIAICFVRIAMADMNIAVTFLSK